MDQNGLQPIIFADLQGFIADGVFIIKELCFLSAFSDIKNHFVFSPPFSWNCVSQSDKKEMIWLAAFHHGFYWNTRGVPYISVKRIIREQCQQPNSIIYVKGLEKVKWLKTLCVESAENIDCRNIEDIGMSSSLSIENSLHHNIPNCGLHCRKSKVCALKTVAILKQWYGELHHQNSNREGAVSRCSQAFQQAEN